LGRCAQNYKKIIQKIIKNQVKMKSDFKIKVETVQHGFALEVGNKSWLLDDAQQLAEAVVFRVAMGSKSEVTKRRMRMLLNLLMYGPRKKNYESRGYRKKGRNYAPTQSRRGRRNYGPQEEVDY